MTEKNSKNPYLSVCHVTNISSQRVKKRLKEVEINIVSFFNQNEKSLRVYNTVVIVRMLNNLDPINSLQS